MNFRDRIMSSNREDEDGYIRFDLHDDNSDCIVNCNDRQMMAFLCNVINICYRIMKDAKFTDQEKKVVVTNRLDDLRRMMEDGKKERDNQSL